MAHMALPAPTYTRMKKEIWSNNHILCDFWFCCDIINMCEGKQEEMCAWSTHHSIHMASES